MPKNKKPSNEFGTSRTLRKISRGGAYKYFNKLIFFSFLTISCIGVGFSSWQIGDADGEVEIEGSVAPFDNLILGDFVETTSVTGFTIGKTNETSLVAGIYEDDIVVYEADIVVTYNFVVNTTINDVATGLFYFYDTTLTDGVLASIDLSLALKFTTSDATFDMSAYVTSASAQKISYSSSGWSGTPGVASDYAKLTAPSSASYTASTPLNIYPFSNRALSQISTITLSVSYHINFGSYSVIATNYDAIASAVITSEVSIA